MSGGSGSGHPEERRLRALAAGELQRAEAAELRSHVDNCLRCRTHLETLSAEMKRTPAGGPREAASGSDEQVLDIGAWQGHPSEELLADFTDEVLEPPQAARLERHLAGCEECRRAVEEARRGLAILALASEPPADLLQHARARRWALERSADAASLLPEPDALPEVMGRGEPEDEENPEDDPE